MSTLGGIVKHNVSLNRADSANEVFAEFAESDSILERLQVLGKRNSAFKSISTKYTNTIWIEGAMKGMIVSVFRENARSELIVIRMAHRLIVFGKWKELIAIRRSQNQL